MKETSRVVIIHLFHMKLQETIYGYVQIHNSLNNVEDRDKNV